MHSHWQVALGPSAISFLGSGISQPVSLLPQSPWTPRVTGGLSAVTRGTAQTLTLRVQQAVEWVTRAHSGAGQSHRKTPFRAWVSDAQAQRLCRPGRFSPP